MLTVTSEIIDVTTAAVITNEQATATATNLEDPVITGPCTVNAVPPGSGIKR
ncbi:hypothetical protein V6C27_05020 [Peptococcaceae bacterium 1198_IL3148]